MESQINKWYTTMSTRNKLQFKYFVELVLFYSLHEFMSKKFLVRNLEEKVKMLS